MKGPEEYAAAVEKFWTSMSDFPDLSVVFDALCKRCKRRSRNPDVFFWMPCEECRSRINRLRPAARSVAH
jgi:hypothetical protein